MGVKMKKTLFIFLAIGMMFLVISGCKTSDKKVDGKPLILTTIYPYELIVRQLVDTLFVVENLIPANASPHTWTPTPQDAHRIHDAALVVSNGLKLETFLHKPLARKGTKNIAAAAFVDKSLLIFESESDIIEEDNEEKEEKKVDSDKHLLFPNPHVWTSPEMLFSIIIGLSNEFSKRYPAHQAYFERNARMMIMELNMVDSKIKLERDTYKEPAVVTMHDAFVYFFRYFNIDFAGSIQEIAGKEPTPRHLKLLADTIRSKKIKAIFIEPQMNPQPAETIAKELNLKILTYDDLGTSFEAKTIADFLWLNWEAFKAGF